MFYAGIGSRETPGDVCAYFTSLGTDLEKLDWVLRSGGADGADKAFAKLVKARNKEIFLPWRGFNAIDSIYDNPPEIAEKIAELHHPAWRNLKDGAKKLHARNSQIVLGPKCDDPVKFVVCWTADGKASGGTGQGLRIAQKRNIPIFNIFNTGYMSAEQILKEIE
jgi:hypothetical protein